MLLYPSQRARVLTEAWAEQHMYCVACDSSSLQQANNNRRAIDFSCESCGAHYQLKAKKGRLGRKVVDAGYHAMIEAIRGDTTPHFLFLSYLDNRVENLILTPSFSVSESAIERRKPLAAHARRAGWVGCSIRLDRIPPSLRIAIVESGTSIPAESARHTFQLMGPLRELSTPKRGWTLDMLRIVQQYTNEIEFSLAQVYECEHELATLYPDNHHVRAKMRQQLQTLRDLGFVEFLGRGRYRCLPKCD